MFVTNLTHPLTSFQ